MGMGQMQSPYMPAPAGASATPYGYGVNYAAGYPGYMPPVQRPQFRTLFRRDKAIVRSDWSFLLLMIIQPFVIGLLLLFLSEPNMLNEPKGFGLAQTVLFSLSVSAVYLGVLLAVRELVKERSIYRRERMVGLRLVPYFLSKISVLSLFGLYQSFVLLLLVLIRAPTPGGGALFWAPLEMFITLFLTTFGGMSLGLLLSAMARTQEVLGALVPMVMIPQFLLSPVIIASLGCLDWVSKLMFTNWAAEALGDSVNLVNSVNIAKAAEGPLPPLLQYESGAGPLLLRWLILISLSASFLGLAWLRQKQRDNYQG